MTTEHTPWEIGLGFTVAKSKSNFRGSAALSNAKGKNKIINVGLEIDHTDMVNGGEVLKINNREVGVVNSPAYSHRMKKSLALAHVSPDAATVGTEIDLVSDGINTTARVVSMPIYDPKKLKTHA